MKATQPFMRRVQALEGEPVILDGQHEERFAGVLPVGAVAGLCLALAGAGLGREHAQRLDRTVGATRHQQRQHDGSDGECRTPAASRRTVR